MAIPVAENVKMEIFPWEVRDVSRVFLEALPIWPALAAVTDLPDGCGPRFIRIQGWNASREPKEVGVGGQ